jgi:aminobenzoyl-glutamate transport protein
MSIDITANWYFAVASALFISFVMTFVIDRIVTPRLGPYEASGETAEQDEEPLDPALEAKGLRTALWWTLATLAVFAVLTIPSWGPLRDPDTGAIIGTTPFMESLIFLITLTFLFAGLGFGRGAGTLEGSVASIGAVVKTYAGLAGLIFLLLIIAQFIAYFNYSNMATVAAVKMADWLETVDIGALWLLIGFILVVSVLNLIIPGIMPKWAIFAPVFIPLFMRLGIAPQTVLAAYRIGDSPTNVITPLMVYLPFIVVVAQRYKRDAGVGTVVSLMIPITVVLTIAWISFFAVWYLLGIPLGPGSPVEMG